MGTWPMYETEEPPTTNGASRWDELSDDHLSVEASDTLPELEANPTESSAVIAHSMAVVAARLRGKQHTLIQF